MSILFQGSFQNDTEPFWARASTGSAIGPDIQVSTLTTNSTGAIILDATGTIDTLVSASASFQKTTDVIGIASDITIIPNIPNGGGVPIENISIVNNTKTFYDPFSVGELNVYGVNNTVLNTAGSVGVIGQYAGTTDMLITTSGLHTSNLFVSSINGGEYPPGDLGPNPSFSTININQQGFIRLNIAGDSNSVVSAGLFFNKTTDFPQTYAQAIKMTTNQLGNILPSSIVENVSLTHVDDIKTPPGIYYDTIALGDVLVYGTNNPKASTVGQVALLTQFSTTTDLDIITTGLHTSNLVVSTINGVPPGGGGSGPNLVISTATVNSSGNINMTATGTQTNPSTAQIFFQQTPDIFGNRPTKLGMIATNIKSLAGIPSIDENLAITRTAGFTSNTTYDNLALGNLFIYGTNNSISSTVGQLGILKQWQTGSTDIELQTTGFHTSSIFASSINCDSLITTQPFLVSTIDSQSIITSSINAPLASLSTLQFKPNFSAGGVDLGLGDFLGSFAGQFASDVYTQSIAGAALATGVVGLIVPRTTQNIYPPGEPSTFQSINFQTQLQYSTIGSQVSSFYRFVSSSDGLLGTVTPGKEYIVSSIIAAGTTCIRSFSDPINLTNASTFTSTVQSFGYWVPVPQQPTTPFSTVVGNFVVQSTLTANRIAVSTSISSQTLTTSGLITGANIASQGVVTAVTNIQAGGNILAPSGNVTALNGIFTTSLQSPALSITGNASITGAVSANIGYINTNLNVGGNISTFSVSAPIVATSSMTVSSINGLPYNPGGPAAAGIFSTMLVSSITNTSSLRVISDTTTSTLNANRITTSTLTANNTTSPFITFGALSSQTICSDVGIYNPRGTITYGIGNISSINTNSLLTSNTITAPIVSTQSIRISTINGQLYPPPFNSTITGNLYITSTLVANDLFAYNSITAVGDIGASGNITGYNGNFTRIDVGGPLDVTGPITGSVGTIGGVLLGPTTGHNTGDVYANTVYCSTITSRNTATLGSLIIPTGGTIVSSNLNMNNGAIIQLSSINGVVYPPFIPTQSTFNQIYTSSIQTSTILALGVATAHGIVNLGNLSTTTINLPQIDIGITTGQISSVTMKSLSSDTVNLTAVKGGMSSLTISTINNLPYPPNGGSSGVFSTITVSSSATIGGAISAPAATIGGVVFSGAGVLTATGVASQVIQASQYITAVQYVSTNIVYSATVNSGTVNSGTVNSGNINNTGYISTPTLYIPQSGNINLGYLAKIKGSDTNQIELGTGFTSPTTSSLMTVAPGKLSAQGAFTVGAVSGLSTILNIDTTDDIGTMELTGYFISSTVGVLAQTTINPGSILLGGGDVNRETFQTTGSGVVDGNWTVLRNLNAKTITASTMSISSILTAQVSSLNTNTASVMNYIGGRSNTGIQKTGPNPPSPIGISQLITGSIYQTGQYNYGSGSGGVFSVNTPYPMPNTYFCCRFPCVVRVIVQSFANAGSLGTQNAQTMNGVWDIFFGQDSATTVGGAYTDAIQIINVYQYNSYMSAIPVSGVANTYQIAPATTINDGRPPTSVVISWVVQPLFIS